jgi:acyl-CoA synthetase (AMP-forming)/AMP-acid ligase II
MPLVGPRLQTPAGLERIIAERAGTIPDDPAIVSSRSAMTWKELHEAADRWAGALTSLGVSPGDRVASLMPNRLTLAIHYLGCIRAGLVAVPLNYRYVPKQIDHALQVSGASVLLAHVERRADLRDSQRANNSSVMLLWYGDDGAAGRE